MHWHDARLVALVVCGMLTGMGCRAGPHGAPTESHSAPSQPARAGGDAGTTSAGVAGDDLPATSPPREPRHAEQIEPELKQVIAELQALFPSDQDWFDAGKRNAAAPRAIPAIRKLFTLGRELATSPEFGGGPDFSDAEKQFLLAQLVVLGDAEAAATVEQAVKSDSPDERATAYGIRLIVDWYRAGTDPIARQRVISHLDDLGQKADFLQRGALLPPAALMARTVLPKDRPMRNLLRQVWTGTLGQDGAQLEEQFEEGDRSRGRAPPPVR